MILSPTMKRGVCLVLPLSAAAFILLVGLLGCPARPERPVENVPEEAGGPEWFQDVTKEVGLDFVHDAGPTDSFFMPQSMGSGCAFLRDGDGALYLYLLHNGGPKGKKNQLYRREPDGTFKDVSKGSGLDVAGYSMGVAVGDVNNDGRPDVLLTQYDGIKLFLNLGAGRFEDVTAESGLFNPVWAMSAAFLDFDRDGLLDLVVVNYKDYDPKKECLSVRGTKDYCGPSYFPDRCGKLFRNLGPVAASAGKSAGKSAGNPTARVRFEDVSFASGIGRLPGPGLGVVCADFNGDGWPDIFVANDAEPNRLWINKRDGTFVDEAASRGVAYTSMGKAFAGMGVAIGDVGGSGRFDLFVTHLTYETNTLWMQEPAGQFQDRTAQAELAAVRWRGTGFGTVMADFNLDGALDLAVVNGRVFRGGPARDSGLGFWEPYAERNQLFANNGQGKFRDVSAANKGFCGYWNVARGLACCDWNDDGAPGLLVTTIAGPARLFRNVAPDRGHWLKARALIPRLKRDAYGAEIRLRLAGGRVLLRLVNPAESYLSSGSPLAHFGLGKHDVYESIDVTWPDGSRERFPSGKADRLVELRQGEGSR